MSHGLSGDQGEVSIKGFKERGMTRNALTHDNKKIRVEFAGRNGDGEVVDVIVGTRNQTNGMTNTGVNERAGFGAGADNTLVVIRRGRARVDNVDVVVHAQGVEVLHDGTTNMAITTDDPFAGGRMLEFRQGGAGYACQPFHQLVAWWAAHGQRQSAGKQGVGIDHEVGAERMHVGSGGRMFGAGNN